MVCVMERNGRAKVAKKSGTREVEAAVDLHGLTAEQMRHTLEQRWAEWRGMRQVRIIHGRGEVLKPELLRWCEEMGIPCRPEPNNPGSSCIYPRQRILPEKTLNTTLREKGLVLTPEEEAYLRDPQTLEKARQEERKRREAEELRKRQAEANQALQKRRDEALWQAEVARLDAWSRSHANKKAAERDVPGAPLVLPPSEIKHQEGYWRAEIVRVGDTDTDTLKKQKRTGLEKLAPPLPPKSNTASAPTSPTAPTKPKRDDTADKALFEEEMARLLGVDSPSPPPPKRG